MDTSYYTMTSDYSTLAREAIIKLLEQRDVELKDRDAELKEKDAEIIRQSHRILELERIIFGRRSEKRLPENPNGWAGTLFDEEWAKEGSLAQVDALPLIKEIKQQAEQRRVSHHASRPSRKGTTYATYVPKDIERQVTKIYPKDYDANRIIIISRKMFELASQMCHTSQ